MKKHYKTLGLQEGASQQEVQEAYDRLSKDLDPANNDNQEFFFEEFALLKEAYKALTGNEPEKQKETDNKTAEISDVFENTKPKDTGKRKHTADKSGKSTLSNIEFNFKNGDLIMVSCYDWSKKMPYTDHLAISFRTKKLKDFINSNPY